MDRETIAAIGRQELVINVRNRWTLIFALVFGTLVVGVSYFGMMAEGFAGLQNFTRTSTSLLNLVLYIVPLVALVMGTLSFTGDKGSTELLFSQPLTRSEVLIGKLLGVFASIVLSMLFGFAIAGIIVLFAAGTDGLLRYTFLVAISMALAFVFLSLSVLSSTMAKRKVKAFGVSISLWFFFVLFYDLVALGGTLLLSGPSSNVFLFLSLFGNPVDMVRVSTLIVLNNATIFGAAGAALIRFFGGGAVSMALLFVGLAMWGLVPLFLSHRLLARQDI
jgi:Cu-processing system permease protein